MIDAKGFYEVKENRKNLIPFCSLGRKGAPREELLKIYKKLSEYEKEVLGRILKRDKILEENLKKVGII